MKILSSILILITACTCLSAQVVGNTSGPSDSITQTELKSILLGKQSKWPDGSRIILVTLKEGDLHDSFLKANSGMDGKKFIKYWKKRVFTGKAKMPKSLDTEDDLITFLSEVPGAIGYVADDKTIETDGVKTIAIE